MNEQKSNHEESVIWKLVKIEENVTKLSSLLASQPLVERKAIERLLYEVEMIAIRCRRRLVEREIEEIEKSSAIEQGIVTPKEIRELLEAFA